MKSILTLGFTLLSFVASGQSVLKLGELYEKAIFEIQEDSILRIEGMTITTEDWRSQIMPELKKRSPLLDSGRVVIHQKLVLTNCQISGSLHLALLDFKKGLELEGLIGDSVLLDFSRFSSIRITDSNMQSLRIKDSAVEKYLRIKSNNFKSLTIEQSRISGYFTSFEDTIDGNLIMMNNQFNGSFQFINPKSQSIWILEKNIFNPLKNRVKVKNDTILLRDSVICNTQLLLVADNGSIDLNLEDNKFLAENSDQAIFITGAFKNLNIRSNQFASSLDLMSSKVSGSFVLVDNEFNQYLDLSDVDYGGGLKAIDWNSIKNNRLSLIRDLEYFGFYQIGEIVNDTVLYEKYQISPNDYLGFSQNNLFVYDFYNHDDVGKTEDPRFYFDLTRAYYVLHSIFKSNGNLRYSNASYVELKELEAAHLKLEFLKKPSPTNLFRWLLNRLMKLFTNHGTDPVLAVTGSLVVILVFGSFYFFFPSEWDNIPKKELKRDLIGLVKPTQENSKPFKVIFKNFLIAYLNATMLSFNAFVTLGFGSIPTTRSAKYVCILQGLLGWFILSIFSVSLINQVLF